MNYLQHRNDILSLRPNGSTTERIANWTFESMPSSIAESNWTCRVESRGDGYKDQPANGGCEIESDKDAIRVWEKTNRERFLNRTTTLPEEGPLFVKVKVTAHIQSSWSHAAAVLSIDSGNGETDIYRLESDYDSSSKTRTVVRRVNITEYAGETVTVSLRADARHTGGDNSWLRAHFIDFEQATDGVVTRDSDGDGIPDFREVKGIPLANGPVVTLDPFDNDTDGDGIPDGEEINLDARVTQEPPNSQALETGYRWSSNPEAGNVDTDGDGLTDSTELDGWTVPTINRSGTAYRYAPHDANGSITVSSDPSDADSDSDGVTDRAEKFQTHTDPSGDVRYAIAGTLVVSEYADTLDHDQDGFPDELELSGIPTRADGEFTRIETDLLDPDTDGDDLHEAEEFRSREVIGRDVGPTEVQRTIFPLISDPTEIDSDEDQVVDRAEVELGTDPLSADTDGDGIRDFRDERPLTDDTPPKISLEALRSTGYITVKDDSKIQVDDIEVKPYFEGEGWKPDQSTVIWRPRPSDLGDRPEYPDRYGYDFEGDKPDKYWVNVTDQNGNQASYLVNFRRNDQSTTQVAVTLVLATPAKQGYKSPPTAVITTGAVLVSATLIASSWQLTVSEADETGTAASLATESIRTYENTPVGDVSLPPGFAKTAGGQTLGYGWAYIQATSGVTQDQIGDILQNGEHVPGEGAVDYVIGQAGERAIILTIVGGTLMAAESSPGYDDFEDECGHTVNIEKTDDQHGLRDDKPINEWERVEKAIKEDVDQIWRSSNSDTPTWLYYLVNIEGKGWTVIKIGPKGKNPIAEWVFSTVLSGDGHGNFFKSKEDAKDAIEDRQDDPERIDNTPDC
ncbi:hypothetical protein [Halosimplex sp. TS25]|uniref:hypothetical protein n=1 Tax=Halosimplex rarum TaxID=3396619 RepID=UPI0039EA5211